MRKKNILGGIILLCTFSMFSITSKANSLSRTTPENGVDEIIPIEIQEYAEIIGSEKNICPELLEAIAWQESNCQAAAINGSCKGLMQVSTACHKDRFKENDWDPEDWDNAYVNMYVAADYLRELFDEYEDVALVLYYYNGDKTNMKKYKDYGYLSNYVSSILETSSELERKHGK